MAPTTTSKWPVIIGLVGFLFTLGYMPFFEQAFTYDEPHYLSNLQVMEQYGYGSDFIINLKGPAGPLYTYIHHFFSPLTQGRVIPTRLVNVLFSLLIILLLYKTLDRLNPTRRRLAALLFSIPMTYSAVAFAHTEIPAMLFFAAFIWLLSLAVPFSTLDTDPPAHRSKLWVYALAGVMLSIAISGRQPYLVCIAGLAPLLLIRDGSVKKGVFAAGIIAMLIPAYLFYHWQGLAPLVGRSIVRQELLSVGHFLLGLGYAATTIGLLAPYFFFRPNRTETILYSLSVPLLYLINLKFDFGFLILYSLVTKIIPEALWDQAGYVMAAVLTAFGIYFIHTLVKRSLERNDKLFMCFALCTFLILLTNISITHIFSTRYVFQAAPLFIVLASYYHENDNVTLTANSLGVALGIASTLVYQ